jgi:hypothetical protein
MMINNKSWKNKRNTYFPSTSSFTNATQYTNNMNDNTDDYFLLINKKLLDRVCFINKQQLDILFFDYHNLYISVSISSWSWHEYGSFKTQSWII